ncbi:LAME_0F14466g1_1 [Lachancea meyersii CBS 8951]|uniref:Protein phosphatase n=1 Tax=Lachancea meyersii CBS 8951 TaxID=1266667 RepID=A0A1G4JXY7_9SACH|nr:LAME_0F14466g1_1 [Lachancea meyersii CBS 8951]
MFLGSRSTIFRGLSRSRGMLTLVVFLVAFTLARLLTKPAVYKWQSWSSRGFFSGPGGASQHSNDGGSSGFNYHYAVAYQAKDRSDGVYAGLTQLDSPTGEDNYFVGVRNSHDIFAGVADGVGGWVEHGFDSSAISRELCASMLDISTLDQKSLSPKQLLDLAYTKIRNDGKVQVGGTTAIVAHLTPNGMLKVANLGDSWCGVFRNTKLVFQTKFQTVGFNAPYQLAIIPPEIAKEATKKGGSYIQNYPRDADEYNFKLQKDDIVVLATDGVTDNIATGDMELFLSNNAENGDLQDVTQMFVDQVIKLSKDANFPSVFAQEMSRLYGQRYLGGKEDDITVVVIKAT